MEDTYKIKNLNALEDSAAKLANNGADLEKNSHSITWILGQINANWKNPEGLDLQTINQNLKECTTQLEGTIIPLIREYAETLNSLVAATREIQRREAAAAASSAQQSRIDSFNQ